MGDEKFEKPGSKSELSALTELMLTVVQDVKEIKEDLHKTEAKWDDEKNELKNRISTLEDMLEQMEKDKTSNNIIITGIQTTKSNKQNVVQHFFYKKLELNENIMQVRVLNKRVDSSVILVELESWQSIQKL